MQMNREEFEEWLEDHYHDAFERLDHVDPSSHFRLGRWVAFYTKALLAEVRDSLEEDEEDDALEDDLDDPEAEPSTED